MKQYLMDRLDIECYGDNFSFDLLTDSILEKIKKLESLIKTINKKLDNSGLDNVENLYYNNLSNMLDIKFLKSYNRGFGNGNGYFIVDLLSMIDDLLTRSNDDYYQFNIDEFNKNLLIIEDLEKFNLSLDNNQ